MDDPKQALRRFASDLGELIVAEIQRQRLRPDDSSTLDPKLAGWFLLGAENYLDGKFATLDHALGLIKVGRPESQERTVGRVRAERAFELELQGKSVAEMAEEMSMDSVNAIDEDTIRKDLERYRQRIIADYARGALQALRKEDEQGGGN